MIDRRAFVAGSLVILAARVPAEAQHAGKIWRLGFLGTGTATNWGPGIDALRLGLRDHGYVEGRNIAIEYRWAENRYDRLPTLAAELVRLNLDVIITHGTPATLSLKQATSTVPIVMSIIGNPVENGVVASLARPGENITGSSFFSDEVTAKRLELLKTARPDVVRVSVLTNTQNIATPASMRALEPIAQRLGIRVDYIDIRSPEALDTALPVATAQSDGIVLTDEQVISTGKAPRHIADFALSRRLPSIGPVHYAEAGGLIGYGVDWTDVVRRSMSLVDKILKGSKPATLPIEQARKFLVSVNLKSAKTLGLTIPPSLLLRADHVIE